MTPPELRKTGDLFEIRWPDGVEVDATRLHDGREGLTAELVVRAALPGLTSPHLVYGRVNLTSIPARKTVAALLKERSSGATINWGLTLEWHEVGL